MSGVVATIAGALTVAVILLLGAIGRRQPSRSLPLLSPPRGGRRVRRVMVISLAITAAPLVVLTGPSAMLVAGGGVAAVAARRRRVRVTLHRRALDAAMADAVELFVLCVHAGRSPSQAVADVAARAPPVLRPAFDAVDLQLHRSRSLGDALGELQRLGGPIGHELASAVAAADRDGLPLAPVLDRLAAEARAARRRAGEAAARQLPVRMTFPLVVCTLPSFVLLAIAPAVLGALSTLRAGAP